MPDLGEKRCRRILLQNQGTNHYPLFYFNLLNVRNNPFIFRRSVAFDVEHFDVQSYEVQSFDAEYFDVQSLGVQSFIVQLFNVQKVNHQYVYLS
jgi:hypothetical protein